jgi:hypothetical protein
VEIMALAKCFDAILEVSIQSMHARLLSDILSLEV